MGINSTKCEGLHPGTRESVLGEALRSASDFDGVDLLKGVALVAAAGVGIVAYNDLSAQNAESGDENYAPKIENENLTAGLPDTAKANEPVIVPPAALTNAGNDSNDAVPIATGPEQKYDIRSDPQFVGMRFKELYYLVTPAAAKQYGGMEEFDKSLELYSRGMSSLFKKFDAGIAVDFRNVGMADPSEQGVKQVLEELNSEYGCSYVREQNQPAKDAIFVWFLDEKEWNEHAWDFGTDKNGVGWTDLGFVIKIPSGTAGMPYFPSLFAHELSHVFGIGDRSGSGDGDDLMYGRGVPLAPSTFGDASRIKDNIDRKLNTC